MKTLLLLSYSDRVLHWSRDEPTTKGFRIDNKTSIASNQIRLDGAGNITKMPELLNKPCFGIPTAWLRHGRQKAIFNKNTKQYEHNSRCDICRVNLACKKVIKSRIRWTYGHQSSKIEIFRKWKFALGFELGGFDAAYKQLRAGAWTQIVHDLQSFDFSSVNDPIASDHAQKSWVDSRVTAQLNRKRDLRRRWRAKAPKDVTKSTTPTFPSSQIPNPAKKNQNVPELATRQDLNKLYGWLDEGREQRQAILIALRGAGGLPRYLRLLRPGFIDRYGAAWWGRELCRFRGWAINPSAVANAVVEHNKFPGQSQATLRQAFKDDLARIEKLEKVSAQNGGAAIWQRISLPP